MEKLALSTESKKKIIEKYYYSLISAESKDQMNNLLSSLDEDVNIIENIKEKWNLAFL